MKAEVEPVADDCGRERKERRFAREGEKGSGLRGKGVGKAVVRKKTADERTGSRRDATSSSAFSLELKDCGSGGDRDR